MAYLGRGWLALFYFLAPFIAVFGAILVFGADTLKAGYLPFFVFNVVGALHGYASAQQNKSHSYPWYARWYSILLLFVVLPFGLRSFTYQPFTIPTDSMAPTLRAGDYMVASKFAYGYNRYSSPLDIGPEARIFDRRPERGDVVLFRVPDDPAITYTKRVVGLPGDRVQLKAGMLYLNGEQLTRIPDGRISINGEDFVVFQEMMPSGRSYSVMEVSDASQGDNTREFLVPDGHYFVLGDNRDQSNDSRYAAVGFIPDANVYAKAIFVSGRNTRAERGWRRVR
jgi:signal peptidase I